MKRLITFLFITCFSFTAFCQNWQDTIRNIEKIFEKYKPAIPGCQLTVSRNGEIIYSKAWGMADLEHNVSLTTESIIEAGSVSKQFTAAAILLLEQEGKLSLSDDVRKYVPELPDYGYTITLRHMMQHTSGLKDWGSVAGIAGWPRSTKTYDNDDALYIISKQKTLNNKPGAEYIYSNSNYNLFAIICERVSGKSLAEFTRIHIFEPAGMKHTEWRNNFKKIVPNRAIAYEKKGKDYFTDMPNEYVYGNGGLLTTTEDLIAWNNFYLNGKLGSPSILSRQLSTSPLNNGVMNPYAAGLRVDSVRGWKSISHTGATASYRASLVHVPGLGLSIAWLSNSSEFDGSTQNVANEVLNIFVKDNALKEKNTKYKSVTISQEKMNNYIGWYSDPTTKSEIKLFDENGKFGSSLGNLFPIKDDVFTVGNGRLEFINGSPKKLLAITARDTIVFFESDSAIKNEKEMNDYLGKYYSDETESMFTVTMKEGKLFLLREPKTEYLLYPTYKDCFRTMAGIFYFERDTKNKVIALKAYVGRARNVAFQKITVK